MAKLTSIRLLVSFVATITGHHINLTSRLPPFMVFLMKMFI